MNGVEFSKMDKKMIMMKSEVVGRPSVVSDDLVQNVGHKVCERWHITVSEFCALFFMNEIIIVRLRLSQVLCNIGS
jgi:hypothetical protein